MLNDFKVLVDTEDSFYSFDCLLIYAGLENLPTFFFRVFLTGLLPVILILLSIPIWYAKQWYDRRQRKRLSVIEDDDYTFRTREQVRIGGMEESHFKMKHRIITTSFVIVFKHFLTLIGNALAASHYDGQFFSVPLHKLRGRKRLS